MSTFDDFCGFNSSNTTYIDGRASGFDNMLGNFTPCFADAGILGISHLVLVLLCVQRIITLQSNHPPKTPVSSKAGYLKFIQLCLVCFSAIIWLIAVLHFDDRIQNTSYAFANLVTIPAPIATYEYLASSSEIVAWTCFLIAAGLELKTGDKRGKWGVRCSVTLVFAGNLAKMWFVVTYATPQTWTHKYYFLFTVEFILQGLVCLLTLFVPPDTWYEAKKQNDAYESLDESGVGIALSPRSALADLATDAAPAGELRSKEFPEFEGSWYSRIMFSWVTPMITQGYKEPLKDENIWSLSPHDRASNLLSDFEESWDGHRKVVATLWNLHRSTFIKAGLWKLLNDGSQFVGPVFLDKLLTSSGSVGYLYAVGIFIGLAIGLLGENQ